MTMVFPCKGGEWVLSDKKMSEYQDTYPGMDLMPSLRRARQWLLDNPERLKTKRGMSRYIGTWLSRDEEDGRLRPLPEPRLEGDPYEHFRHLALTEAGRIEDEKARQEWKEYARQAHPTQVWNRFRDLTGEELL